MMEYSQYGMVEYWRLLRGVFNHYSNMSANASLRAHHSNIPLFLNHYSNIPLFHGVEK
jgi:hypothetical protein